MTLPKSYDARRDIVVPGDKAATLDWAVEHFVQKANEAIKSRGFFAVALSGGTTPKALFEKLSSEENAKRLPWDKVRLFWSDERSVGPTSPDNNFRMAMDAGLRKLTKKENTFRMKAERDIEIHAILYEDIIQRKAKTFDLVMLGCGEDGHTASLFPGTQALVIEDRMVVTNYVPQKETWRMTLTFPGIHNTRAIAIYALGASKADIIHKVLTSPFNPNKYPIQNIGTKACKALWIMDKEAAKKLLK